MLAEDMARELTLLQGEAYGRLQPWELVWWFKARLRFHDVVLRRDGDPEARARMERKMPRVVQLIDQLAGIVHWVRREVDDAGRAGPLHRTSALRYFFLMSQVPAVCRVVLSCVVLCLQCSRASDVRVSLCVVW